MIALVWQTETGRHFNYKSEDFTLERIIEWGFDQFSDKIKDISSAASKELAIENALADINNTWEYTVFDLIPYKDKGHFKIRYILSHLWNSCVYFRHYSNVAAAAAAAVIRPMSDTQQSRATLSLNFVARQICLGNCQFFTGKQSPNRPLRYLATGKQPLQLTSLTT